MLLMKIYHSIGHIPHDCRLNQEKKSDDHKKKKPIASKGRFQISNSNVNDS